MFVGAASTFTFDQCQIDVEFSLGPPVALNYRLIHICIGLSFAFLHTESQGAMGWISGLAAGIFEVHDHGPSIYPSLPALGVALQSVIVVVGGAAVSLLTAGFLIAFGHRLVVSYVPPMPQPSFIYVSHYRPQPHREMVSNPNRLPFNLMKSEYRDKYKIGRELVTLSIPNDKHVINSDIF